MPKSPFSYEKHKVTGSRLREMRNELNTLIVDLLNGYGERAEVSRLADRSQEALDELRWALHKQSYQDCPDKHEEDPVWDIYV